MAKFSGPISSHDAAKMFTDLGTTPAEFSTLLGYGQDRVRAQLKRHNQLKNADAVLLRLLHHQPGLFELLKSGEQNPDRRAETRKLLALIHRNARSPAEWNALKRSFPVLTNRDLLKELADDNFVLAQESGRWWRVTEEAESEFDISALLLFWEEKNCIDAKNGNRVLTSSSLPLPSKAELAAAKKEVERRRKEAEAAYASAAATQTSEK
jgi:hypothetical protein